MMTRNEALIIAREYANIVRAKLDADASVYLFGSVARDTMNEYSDIDIAVVSSKLEGNIIEKLATLSKLARNMDCGIEAHLVSSSDWEYRRYGLVASIRKEGIPV